MEPTAHKSYARKAAIVGAGPSAFFTAEALLDGDTSLQLDIIDRLPVPHGLVRFGVAPDHPITKRVSELYDRILADPRIGFFGNVEVGRDIDLDRLRVFYDAVVFATGAPDDSPLTIPGYDLRGSYGSARFVGWYNAHPDHAEIAPDLTRGPVVVIGLGNVALDIARLLVRPSQELAVTDMANHALEAISAAKVSEVVIVGRRGPLEARFTYPELKEFGSMSGVTPVVDPDQLPATSRVPAQTGRFALRNLAVFRDYATRRPNFGDRTVRFMFEATPIEVLGSERVEGLRVATRLGTRDIACGCLVSAIGFQSLPLRGLPVDPATGRVQNEGGKVEQGVYVVGWARRGASGVIGTNKPDGASVAARILAECAVGSEPRPGGRALEDHLRFAGTAWVDQRGWCRIDAAERAGARPGAPRWKLPLVSDMLATAGRPRRADG